MVCISYIWWKAPPLMDLGILNIMIFMRILCGQFIGEEQIAQEVMLAQDLDSLLLM